MNKAVLCLSKVQNKVNPYPDFYDSLYIESLKYAEYLLSQDKTWQSKYIYKQLNVIYGDSTFLTFKENNNNQQDKPTPPKFNSSDSLTQLRKTMITEAEKVVGTPYLWAGTTPAGFDCSGFTQYVYKQVNIEIPRNGDVQKTSGVEIDIKDAQPGDLIVWLNGNYGFHAGIIYANDEDGISLIHCPNGGVAIHEPGNNNNTYWLDRDYTVRRIVGVEKELCESKNN
jgi:cell wall-associated NlpC family hydrolase